MGGFGRSDYFAYRSRFNEVAGIAPRVLLEAGTSSGTYPTETRPILSYVSAYLRDTGTTLKADDEVPFDMSLLHFRRTFVEKMFAIHAKVEMFKQTGQPIGSYARHYYDLWCLAQQPDVSRMLQTDEYADIKVDYERVSLQAYSRGYFRPDDMSFANSDALFPSVTLGKDLSAAYVQQCELLCYGEFPSWLELLSTFENLRMLL